MHYMEIWRLTTDILLAGALVYLALRMLRKPAQDTSALEMQGLEQSLRRVVQEADLSSRTLGTELLKRKQDLEKLLFDLGTVEHRLNRAINSAEERKGALELECSRAAQLENEIHLQKKEMPRAAAVQPGPQTMRLNQAIERTILAPEPVSEPETDAPEPPSFETALPRHTASIQPAARSIVAYNIYGDPIGAASSENLEERDRGLVSQVTKEINTASSAGKTLPGAVEDIFSAAEDMIRAGQDLRLIAQKTDLPLEDLQMLSQVVKREQALRRREDVEQDEAAESASVDSAVAFSRTDQRLGVLAGMKRQVQVL